MATTSDSNKEAQHNQIEIWRAETVRDWTQALTNLAWLTSCADNKESRSRFVAMQRKVSAKIEHLLGIADDEGGK